MLRASVETEGNEVDYRGIADAASAEDSSVPGAGALIGLVEASLSSDEENRIAARGRVRSELGSEVLVDAAGVIGNFERMVRIADGTGIPLDAPVNVATEAVRSELGIDAYATAENTRSVRGWQRLVGKIVEPIARIALRQVGRRARSRDETATDSRHDGA
jgi:hypothetical protein